MRSYGAVLTASASGVGWEHRVALLWFGALEMPARAVVSID
jgi:hypothetical protein